MGGFIGEDYERVKMSTKHGPEIDAVLAKIEGHSFYNFVASIGMFLVEPSDRLGKTGFLVEPTAMYRKRQALRANAMSSRGFVNVFEQAIQPRV
jgi:hypothetical protein